MAELAELYAETLNAVIEAVERSEREHLLNHVEAVTRLEGEQPGLASVKIALEAGWLPDYFLGAEAEVTARMSVAITRKRETDAEGGITFGPLRLTGRLSDSLTRGSETNLTVNTRLRRQSRAATVERALVDLTPAAG